MPFSVVPFLFKGLHCSWSVENILKCANSNIARHVLKVYTTHLNYDILRGGSFASCTVFILCENSIVLANKASFTFINYVLSGAAISISVPHKFISNGLLFTEVFHRNYIEYLTLIFTETPRDIVVNMLQSRFIKYG